MNGSFGPMDILSLLTFGLPVRSGIIEVDSALHRHGVRERVTLIASGKLFSSDRIQTPSRDLSRRVRPSPVGAGAVPAAGGQRGPSEEGQSSRR